MKAKWVCEIEVEDTWLADGFRLTDERLKRMIENEIEYAHGYETAARVISGPTPEEINVMIDELIEREDSPV